MLVRLSPPRGGAPTQQRERPVITTPRGYVRVFLLYTVAFTIGKFLSVWLSFHATLHAPPELSPPLPQARRLLR